MTSLISVNSWLKRRSVGASKLNKALLENIIGGLVVDGNKLLIAVTEKKTKTTRPLCGGDASADTGREMIMSRYKDTPLILNSRLVTKGVLYPSLTYRSGFCQWSAMPSRGKPNIPDVDEISVVRHFTNLSAKNYHVEVRHIRSALHDE